MPITVSELYHDTCYFFRKQIKIIFFISISVTFFNVLMEMLFRPDMYIVSIIENNNLINTTSLLELINNMNLDARHALFKYSIIKMIVFLISKTILISSIINLILHLSKTPQDSILSSIFSLIAFFPGLLILNFLITIITQLGFVLFIIPGILLSITLPLSPIIFAFKKNSLLDSLRISVHLSWKYIRIIGPGILFWIFGKFAITMLLLSYIYLINQNIILFILNMSINIIYSLLIIYLCRFYMIFLRS